MPHPPTLSSNYRDNSEDLEYSSDGRLRDDELGETLHIEVYRQVPATWANRPASAVHECFQSVAGVHLRNIRLDLAIRRAHTVAVAALSSDNRPRSGRSARIRLAPAQRYRQEKRRWATHKSFYENNANAKGAKGSLRRMHPTHSHHHSRLVTNLTCRAPQVELLALHTRVAPTSDSSALGKRYDYATSTARECPQHRCQAMWNATLPCAGSEPESFLPLALFFWTAGAGDAESCTHDPCSWCAQHKSEARPSSASLCQPSSLVQMLGFLVPCFSPGLVLALGAAHCACRSRRRRLRRPLDSSRPRHLGLPGISVQSRRTLLLRARRTSTVPARIRFAAVRGWLVGSMPACLLWRDSGL